jgi:multiple sugar transport system substrate-binding protein
MRKTLSRRDFLKQAALTTGALAAAGLPAVTLASPPQQEPVFLRAMTIGDNARAQTFENVLGEFREANPDIDLELVPVAAPEWDQFLAKVATILAAGEQLDNVEVGTEGQLTFANAGIIRALDDFVMAEQEDVQEYFSDVNPIFVEAVMYEGSLYNLPNLWAAAGIMYNKHLFDQAGLEHPTNDWTVEQFLEAARAINDLGDDIFGYGWPNRHWGGFVAWSFANDSTILTTEQFEGGDWLWDTFYADMPAEARARRGGGFWYPSSNANDPRNVEALQMLQDLAWVDNASMTPAGFGDLFAAFTSNKLGMLPSHRAWVANFTAAGLTPDDYDVVYMPRWKTQKSQYGASALAITTLSQQPEAAWRLLRYLTSKDVQNAYVAGGVHTATRRSVATDPVQNEVGPNNWSAFYGMVDEIDAAPIPAPPQNRDFTVSFTKWIGLAMANEATPQDALDNMHNELNALLGA